MKDIESAAQTYIITADCPSRTGTVDVVTRFLFEQQCYINEIHSFVDTTENRFFIRVEFRLDKVVIMVSKHDHCLNDLLYRYRTGDLNIEIPAIISNHPDLEELAKWHDIPYYYLPITKETKPEQEAEVYKIIEESKSDLVVLARYMQVLSSDMSKKLSGRAINIHHSLLPGFKGAKPYYQAYDRGIKLVGATAHYVSDDLDEGPIITQSVDTVDHSYYPEDLAAKGRHIECLTLSRAVRYHIEKRIFLHGNKTVVFGK